MIPLLKKKLEDNGYIVDEPTPNVIVVENFLSDSELKEIHDIIKNTTEEDWMIEYTQNLKRFCLEKFGREDVDNLVAEGKFETQEVRIGEEGIKMYANYSREENSLSLMLHYTGYHQYDEEETTTESSRTYNFFLINNKLRFVGVGMAG